jgi:hypothetical protein
MLIKKLPNAAASLVTVTAAAAQLHALIATAAGSAFAPDDSQDSVVVVPEDGDVRVLFDGNTPTATQGLLLKSGSAYSFSGFPVLRMSLIRTGAANVKVSVQVGQAASGDGPLVSPAVNATVDVGSIEIGDVKVGSPDGGTTKTYLKTEADGTVVTSGATEATLDDFKTAFLSVVTAGIVNVTDATVLAEIEKLTALIASAELKTHDADVLAALGAGIDVLSLPDGLATATGQQAIIDAMAALSTEATLGDVKTAVEALAAVIDGGELKVTLVDVSALALESGGNLADIKASTDKIPSLGAAAKAAAVPVTMATDQPAMPMKLSDDTNVVAIGTAGADGSSNTQNSLSVEARLAAFNGTTWDRLRTAVVTVSSTLTGFLNTLPWGVYHSSPTTRTDGQGGPLETAANGDLKTTNSVISAIFTSIGDFYADCTGGWTYAYYNATSAKTDQELVAAPSAGNHLRIKGVYVFNGATAGTVIFEEDTASAKTAKVQTLYPAIGGGCAFEGIVFNCTSAKNFGFTSATVTTHSVGFRYRTVAD